MAKLNGVKVNEFAMGMGPTIFKIQKGETKYALRLFPIGGFCAMEGEDEESDDSRAFGNKAVWRRIVIVAAGAIMNLILGLILMMILLVQEPMFSSTTISKFTDNSALQNAGLQAGDTFYEVNGYRILSQRDLSYSLATADPNSVDLVVSRKGQLVTFDNVKFNTKDSNGNKIMQLDFYVQPIQKTVWTLISQSASETVSTVRMVWSSLVGLVSGKYGIKDMAGPVGVASAIGQAATVGLQTGLKDAINNIIFLMVVITVNLGIFNLLPLPALDGGRLVFLIIEGIRRKPVNPKYEGWVHAAGFALLIALMLTVTFSDIMRLITGKGLGG